MKLAIFGANGPVGRLLTQQALDEGHSVIAVTRRPGDFPIAPTDRLTVQKGDVLEAADVTRAVAGCDAVLSTFGVPFSRKPITVYSEGIKVILAAMHAHNVRRLIAVTAGGTNPKFDLREGIVWSLLIKPIFGRTLYADMRRMEEIVQASDVDWTIVRPALLVDSPGVTTYRVEEAYVVENGFKTARRDLADFMLRQGVAPTLLRKAVAIASPV